MQYIFRFPADTERREKWLCSIVIHLSYPEYVLAIHSLKRFFVEQISPSTFILADAIINLTLAKGQITKKSKMKLTCKLSVLLEQCITIALII